MKQRFISSRGFSLIEMLVGILIISFGLLGLITLQARALQVSVSSEDSQRAAILASEMAATMLNRNSVNVDAAVVAAWAARASDPASGGLPNGAGTVSVTNATTARVTLTWTPVQSNGAANDTHNYFTDVVIP
ncbi:type IV pilus modification PilV family protein [Roseateles sp. NT4]|uniref:type IV pilus modification PilV family protein n=1 Tax=Roseateles sp. NT4 TaxID=3453715 RepID=UPI003EED582A